MKRAWCNPEQSFSKLDKKKIRCRRRRRRISRFSDWWCTLLEFTHRIHQSVVDLQFIKCRAWNCGNKKTRYSSITSPFEQRKPLHRTSIYWIGCRCCCHYFLFEQHFGACTKIMFHLFLFCFHHHQQNCIILNTYLCNKN